MRFDAGTVEWTEKVESNSRIVDPLGIWSSHLSIQGEFTPGITSVTRRARYYTIWAYYYEYLYDKDIIRPLDYEKLFILASLAHHDGFYDSPGLRRMYNNRKFAGKWDEIQNFDFDFEISGLGKVYYNQQMEVLRCAWTNQFRKVRISMINSRLARSLSFLNPENFKKNIFTKQELRELFSGFCICQISNNSYEKDILSKLMFGFFSEKDGNWDIDEDEFERYMNGHANLVFKNRPEGANNFQEYSEYHSIEQRNIRRRNTLLLFLKIINETNPKANLMLRYIWDAIYCRQNRDNKQEIKFGKLEQARTYWEIHQLNIYYVFLLEKFLEQIQNIVIQNVGIRKKELVEGRDHNYLFSNLSEAIGINISNETSLDDLLAHIIKTNGADAKSSLNSRLNESDVYDYLGSDNPEVFLSEFIIMICLLYIRYYQIFIDLKGIKEFKNNSLTTEQINIDQLFNYIKINKTELTIVPFLSNLSRIIVNRHLLESAQRFANNTKNWIFVEEEGHIFSAREPIRVTTRDNRWQSIRTLLEDLEFIDSEGDSSLLVTEKGLEWLKKCI